MKPVASVALVLLLVSTNVLGTMQPQRNGDFVTSSDVISVLSLRPLASTLNSALQKIKEALSLKPVSGEDPQHKIRDLYDQLLDLQDARESYLRGLTSYIKEKQRNPKSDQLRTLGRQLLEADEKAQGSFVKVLNTLKELQVQLDIDDPSVYATLRSYLHANQGALFIDSFFRLNMAQLSAIAKDVTENGKILKEAIDGLRSFIKEKYPPSTS